MSRLLTTLALLLGVLSVPLAVSALTSWLAVGAHALVALLASLLALREGWAGRPAPALAWGAWTVVVTGGLVGALHLASWARDGWAWAPPFLLVLVWAWIPPVVAGIAARVGVEVRAMRATSAVRARRRAQSAA